MRVTITLPDDLAAQYAADAVAHRMPLEDLLARQLTPFSGLTDRTLVLSSADLSLLTERLGTFIISDAADLVRKVTALRDLKVGEVRVNLAPAQIEEIRVRADKNGIPFADEFEHIVQQAVDGLQAYA